MSVRITQGNEGQGEGDGADGPPTGDGGYEPPRIVWREPYDPLCYGISCAKQPGNPSCNPGPLSS